MPLGEPRDVRAAGAVVTRKGGAEWEVLLVHRPEVRRLVLPQGQARPRRARGHRRGARGRRGDRARRPAGAGADRRSATGCPTAAGSTSTTGPRRSSAATTSAATGPTTRSTSCEWVPWKAAATRLTYPHDRETLAEARPLRRRTHALVVLRHGKARSRGGLAPRTTGCGPLRAARRGPGRAAGAVARRLRRDLGCTRRRACAACRPCGPTSTRPAGRPSSTTSSARSTRAPRASSSSSTPCSTAPRARCCAPTGRCCPTVVDALGRRGRRARARRDAGGPPPQGPGRGHRGAQPP